MLLAATALNLATCPLSQPLELDYTRRTIEERVLQGTASPQIIIRLGWAPISSPDLPETPRLKVDQVLSYR